MEKYHPARFGASSFHCLFCGTYAAQSWLLVGKTHSTFYSYENVEELKLCRCSYCERFSIWHNKELIYPRSSPFPAPHDDLPDGCKEIYREATDIGSQSPRSAAALLRLCLQMLLVELGEKGKNINDDIASQVSKGLPETVQKALDILRVYGNHAVHPGAIDIDEDPGLIHGLCELINFIVEERITRHKRISEMFSKLPERDRENISKRDSK